MDAAEETVYAEEGPEGFDLEDDETYDEEHSPLLGFMKGYEQDQQGLVDDVIS